MGYNFQYVIQNVFLFTFIQEYCGIEHSVCENEASGSEEGMATTLSAELEPPTDMEDPDQLDRNERIGNKFNAIDIQILDYFKGQSLNSVYTV